MKLNQIPRPRGSNRSTKRLGRGGGSGHGGTSTRGHKGQWSRTGGGVRPGFEGGQMPLIRRLPKFGFTAHPKQTYQVVNLKLLERFPAGATVDEKALVEAGLVRPGLPVKVLAQGELKVALTVKARAFSKKAAEKIATAGGQAITG